ncbi:peptidase S41 [Lysinibacillus sp. 2017]|uniref:S41 family peptidase n=1 Tax=unclassified Lysinibacillus TaxID=2636778 RepID=UPI000D5266AA|nr:MULTISPECIES: S41 family peptidase [unclassified Lysinibacillus]AWE06366.1 peptidase S41 [Lysinibacillus sp. 2017]TGN31568.1 PDZ domain-containing protein [Lysinibacillus sp. S2017]
MIKKQLATMLFFILCLALPFSVFASPLDEAKQIVKENYVGDVEGTINNATTIPELMNMLDPYSTYFTADEFNSFLNAVDLTSVGIGIVIEKVDSGIKITDLIDGGSAKNGGLKTGDIITAVDGTSTTALTLDQASSRITGKENTSVTLTILHEDGSILTKTLTRKAFSLPNSSSKLLYGNVGYISLSSFSNDATSLLSKAVQQLKNQGATSFILDLQNNGGGYVTASEQIIGMFPNAKNAYKLKEATGTTIVHALKQSTTFPENTKVLVNKSSASASEMTAAALLDQKAATLYGQTTYGKGAMQAFYELEDGSYLKLTVGHFYGPNGTEINHIGVNPNVKTTANPLYQAHFDAIAAGLSNSKELASLKNVALTKTFTITFSKQLAASIDPHSVQLIELGSNAVEATVKQDGQKLLVTPKDTLTAGKEYMLVIQPRIKNSTGKSLKQGAYLHITTVSK